MKPANWKDVIELVGIGAIVASLVFVGLQLKQEQEIALVNTYGSVADAGIDLSIQVGENMDVWRKALDGQELSAVEYGVFRGLFNGVMIHYQENFIRRRRLGPFNPNSVAAEFAYALYIFPGLRSAFEERISFRRATAEARQTDLFLSIYESTILSDLAGFEETKPPIPDAKPYIFWAF